MDIELITTLVKMGSIQSHNKTTLEDLQPGDTVEFKRGAYSHWAVYVGDGKVVHMTGADDGGINSNSGNMFTICGKLFNKAVVKKDYFWDVVCDSKAYKNNRKDRKYSPCDVDEILNRALSKIGKIGYNILWQNCEHFASYCRYGKAKSYQADKVLTGVAIGAVAVGGLIAAGIGGSATRSNTE